MQKFKKKPIEIEAEQYTQDMQDYFVSRGDHPYENPVTVKLHFMKDCDLNWNWHTNQLSIQTSEGEMQINVGDWIIKEPFDKKRKYYPCKPDIFKKTYDILF